MRIISLNCNGIRSAHQKGLFEWLSRQRADVLCLQEIKAQTEQLTDAIKQRRGWHSYFMPAEKPGYSGVAVYSRHAPDNVVYGFGNATYDGEGRYLQLDFGSLSIASLYLPSGSSSEARQQVKFEFLDYYLPRLQQQRRDGREYVLCGDWNIAHKEIDLKNWRANQKNSGFLPEERAFMETVFTDVGYVDAFRQVNSEAGQYTWWSNRGQAWANNVGWRIDYQVITPGLAGRVAGASIYKRKRFSDHAPLLVDYTGELSEIAAA